MNRDVLLMLGSNIEPHIHIKSALRWLRIHPELTLVGTSARFITAPVGKDGRRLEQPDYHNVAAHIRTQMGAAALKQTLRLIEHRLGRVRTQDRFAARPIDLDISFFGNESLNLEGSAIPDPDVLRYPHVAVPLADLAPDWIHPLSGSTLRRIAQDLAPNSVEIERQ